jgi:hypothetical protein
MQYGKALVGLLSIMLGSLFATSDAADHGFDAGVFRRWVDMRVGKGEQIYWYAVGTV